MMMMMMLAVQTGQLLRYCLHTPQSVFKILLIRKKVFENITAKIWRILDTSITALFSPLFPEVGFRDRIGLGSETPNSLQREHLRAQRTYFWVLEIRSPLSAKSQPPLIVLPCQRKHSHNGALPICKQESHRQNFCEKGVTDLEEKPGLFIHLEASVHLCECHGVLLIFLSFGYSGFLFLLYVFLDKSHRLSCQLFPD